MFRWIPYAFVRIVVFFCGGVLLAIYWPGFFPIVSSHILFCFLCLAYLLLAFTYSRYKINPGLVGMSAIFMAGYINTQWKNESLRDDHLMNLKDSVSHYTAVITKPAEERERSWKYEARVLQVNTVEGWRKANAKILLYGIKSEFSDPFNPGDNLIIRGEPLLIPGPSNPGEFDYQKFSAFKNIFHQHFIRRDQVVWLDIKPANSFMHYAMLSRIWADSVLQANVQGKRERALASALVLGVTDGLDNELMNAYAASGAMHILSVSGLHVGIVYWVILLLFKPFKTAKYTPWILAGTSLAVLWMYAFITGISPSVLRAVTMFSFMALARPLNRVTNIYNTLGASAFFLLLYDPFMIMSVGFQLSYLAVVGIVTLQPGLYRLCEPTNRVMDEVWKITSVSIAAQLATFALGLYYFHQFPNYFLLANLFVIPISFVVLLMGIGIILTGYFTSIAAFLGYILNWVIKAMNEGVFLVERLPFSILDNVYITSVQCWILMLLIAVIYIWIETKDSVAPIIVSVLCIVFAIVQWVHVEETIDTTKMIVYKIPGHTAIDFVESGSAFFLADSTAQSDPSKTKFHIMPARLMAGVKHVLPCDPIRRELKGCAILVWNGKKILQILETKHYLPQNIDVDFVIISNNSVRKLDEVLTRVNAKQIIIDSSNSFQVASRLLKESNATSIEIISVLHEGAYTKTI